MNAGFREAMREEDWDCLFFHDVDLIPEDDRNTYTCDSNPKHAAIAMDKFGYKYVPPLWISLDFAPHRHTSRHKIFWNALLLFCSDFHTRCILGGCRLWPQCIIWKWMVFPTTTGVGEVRTMILESGENILNLIVKDNRQCGESSTWAYLPLRFWGCPFEQAESDICFSSSQSVFGRNVHYTSLAENWPLQDD